MNILGVAAFRTFVEAWARLAEALRDEALAHAAGLLSARDVYALPDWTRVEIVWSGGNGPHPYDVVKIEGRPYAILTSDNPWRDPDTDDDIAAGRVPRCASGMEIEWVGRNATRVRILDPGPSPPL